MTNEEKAEAYDKPKSGLAEYRAWYAMRRRCKPLDRGGHHRYGGRGISVCDRWESFDAFLEDMGAKPSKQHSIERIDNDGDYTPENCRWATKKEQARNTARNHFITIDGETKTLGEWCDQKDVLFTTVIGRLNRGWSPSKALSRPSKESGAAAHLSDSQVAEIKSLAERGVSPKDIATRIGVCLSTVHRRLRGTLEAKPNKTKAQVIEEIYRLRDQGLSYEKIGALVGVTGATCRNWCLRRKETSG